MELVQSGFILYTIRYKECVFFYEEVLRLPVLYRKEMLTCFEMGGSYLMVEVDDETEEKIPTPVKRDRTCLRFNVQDVKQACELLDAHGIAYSYGEYDWGTIAKFRDPDGNLIGFRSAKEHEEDKG
ncbi:MAG: VOC family protein [Bacteroidota bacterium]